MNEGKFQTLITARPDSFSISPRRADMRELLPVPTGPTTAKSLPSGTLKLML